MRSRYLRLFSQNTLWSRNLGTKISVSPDYRAEACRVLEKMTEGPELSI